MRKHERSLIRIMREQLNCPRFGVEIGVWKGELSAQLLRVFPDLTLVMVDLWAVPKGRSSMQAKDNTDEAMRKAMQEAEENTRFAQDRRSLIQNDSIREAKQWPDDTFDVGFLDAEHFETKRDIVAWWPKIQQGGILAGHDYNGMGDRRKGWGVKRDVDEFFSRLGLDVYVEPGLVWWAKKP